MDWSEEFHDNVEDVKNRILEFIAVSKLKGAVGGKSRLDAI